RGGSDPCSQTCKPVILLVTPLAELVVVAAVPDGNGMISEPNVAPPSVDRRIRMSPLVWPLNVCQATKTSPFGPAATSEGQVNPSPPPERIAGADQVRPPLVDRENFIGAFGRAKSCQIR